MTDSTDDVDVGFFDSVPAKYHGGKKPQKRETKKVLQSLKLKLQMNGINVASIQNAVGTNSIYVKFTDERLRSLTVRDHPGIPKYRYKWSLYKGWKGENEVMDNGVRRFYYNFNQIDALVTRLVQYKNACDNSIRLSDEEMFNDPMPF